MATFSVWSCKDKKKQDPTPAQTQMEKLTGSYSSTSSRTWTVKSIFFETTEDRTASWPGFSLTLSTNGSGSNTYASSNELAGGPWPATGSWSFGGTADVPDITTLVRDDGLEMNVIINTATTPNTLVLTFTFDDTVHQTGKMDAINGEYVFTLESN